MAQGWGHIRVSGASRGRQVDASAARWHPEASSRVLKSNCLRTPWIRVGGRLTGSLHRVRCSDFQGPEHGFLPVSNGRYRLADRSQGRRSGFSPRWPSSERQPAHPNQIRSDHRAVARQISVSNASPANGESIRYIRVSGLMLDTYCIRISLHIPIGYGRSEDGRLIRVSQVRLLHGPPPSCVL